MSLWNMAIACPVAAALLAVLALRRCFVVVQVTGTSMSPALMPGDRVLVRRGAGDRLRVGLIVVLGQPRDECLVSDDHETAPGHRWVIKRVAAMHGDVVPEAVRRAVGGTPLVPPGMLVVLGDNPGSADSRTWGFLPAAQVEGVAVRRLPRPVG
jgi:signal peptidase I